jgi:hypothetical protein
MFLFEKTFFLVNNIENNANSNTNNISRTINTGTTSSIGGMASSMVPDTNSSSSAIDSEKHSLLSNLRPESNESSTLQFESNSGLLDDLEDTDEDIPRSGEKRSGRRKIKIEYIEDKSRRHITFSKRKAGIMKKVRDTF